MCSLSKEFKKLQGETADRNIPPESKKRTHKCMCEKTYDGRRGLRMHIYKCSLLKKMTSNFVYRLWRSAHETKDFLQTHLLNSTCTNTA